MKSRFLFSFREILKQTYHYKLPQKSPGKESLAYSLCSLETVIIRRIRFNWFTGEAPGS